MRFTAAFPLAFSIIAFVLSILCLLAGHKPGFMEEYHVVALNTSTLGHNLANDTATPTSPSAPATTTGSGLGSFISSITGEVHNLSSSIADELESGLNKIKNDLADDLSKLLGIHQWYSLHIMDMCEGNFAPNATAKGASYNVTNCTAPVAMFHFNLTSKIRSELAKTDLNLTLSDIDFPSDIQKGINDLATALDAVFVLYCVAIAASGLAILGAAVAMFFWGSRFLSFANWGLCVIGFFALILTSAIVTVAQSKLVNEVNKHGNDIGLFAYKGHKFVTITWSAVAAIFVASCCWVLEFCAGRLFKGRSDFTSTKPFAA